MAYLQTDKYTDSIGTCLYRLVTATLPETKLR